MKNKLVMTIPAVVSIFKSNVKKLGFFRATIGGYLMYTTIPLFIFLHITTTTIFYSFVLRPLLKLPKKKYSSYIILDRYNLNGLSAFDRFNCLFCEYASGITTLLNSELDTISKTKFQKVSLLKKILLHILILIQTTFFILNIVITYIPTYIFMKLLGYRRVSSRYVIKLFEKNKYAQVHPLYVRILIYIHKLVATVLMYNLSQIEPQWCPIKHLEKSGQIVPTYQKKFIDRKEMILLKDILSNEEYSMKSKKNVDILDITNYSNETKD